jgi:hypothetical protein
MDVTDNEWFSKTIICDLHHLPGSQSFPPQMGWLPPPTLLIAEASIYGIFIL